MLQYKKQASNSNRRSGIGIGDIDFRNRQSVIGPKNPDRSTPNLRYWGLKRLQYRADVSTSSALGPR